MPLGQQANTFVRQLEEMGGPALPLRRAVEANPSRPESGRAVAAENKHGGSGGTSAWRRRKPHHKQEEE